MQGEPGSRPAGLTVWGWSLTASTLFHLILIFLSVGDSGTAFHARGGAGTELIRLRLVGAERPATEPGRDPGQAALAPERVEGQPAQKGRGVTASSTQPAQTETLADYSDYFAKAYLSVNPEPLAPVDIPTPEIAGLGTVQVELSIFIDEYGKVRRVRPETPGVREPYVEAARQAFEATPFKPGEIAGRPVKSVIKVVVEFQQL